MRYAPEHNHATRERILDAASRLFREHGIAAVGLAKIMAEAELTVGTFYTQVLFADCPIAPRASDRAGKAFRQELSGARFVEHLEK